MGGDAPPSAADAPPESGIRRNATVIPYSITSLRAAVPCTSTISGTAAPPTLRSATALAPADASRAPHCASAFSQRASSRDSWGRGSTRLQPDRHVRSNEPMTCAFMGKLRDASMQEQSLRLSVIAFVPRRSRTFRVAVAASSRNSVLPIVAKSIRRALCAAQIFSILGQRSGID